MDSNYKTELLDHFHNPRNKGDLDVMDVVRRGSNPRCGDDIEVGVSRDDNGLTLVRFRGRGCSLCLSSASMMSEYVTGLSYQQSEKIVQQQLEWFDDTSSELPFETRFAALTVIRQHPARAKCVTLAWKALNEAMKSLTKTLALDE